TSASSTAAVTATGPARSNRLSILSPRRRRCGPCLSFGHGVAMAVRHLPLTALAPVHLRGAQGVAARLAVDGGRRVLESGGIGHVARHVVRLKLELVRRAVGEALREGAEQLVELILPEGVAPRTQDAHGLVAGPERPPRARVAVVKG